ncbi:MAG: alpha/beta hydrolase [Desulfobacterales bacterium]|jgi:alpha/beta superfamily hydrolase
MEKKVCFRSGDFELEGLFENGRTTRGVVITHPHPLYGGDMHNLVVDAIRRAYRMKGVATLRFNFRGAGESEGQHDNGVGEQDDVLAALSFLTESGFQPVDLAGYSFGAWVNALMLQREGRSENLVMVSPPVAFVDFASIGRLPGLRLVVTGSRDEIAPPGVIRQMLTTWNLSAHFDIIDGSDHFYNLHTRQLEDVLGRHI